MSLAEIKAPIALLVLLGAMSTPCTADPRPPRNVGATAIEFGEPVTAVPDAPPFLALPSPLASGPEGARSRPLHGGRPAGVTALLGPLVYVLVSLFRGIARIRAPRAARRAALREALDRLRRVCARVEAGRPVAPADIYGPLRACMADRLNVSPAALTPAQADRQLSRARDRGDRYARLSELFGRSFDAAYAPGGADAYGRVAGAHAEAGITEVRELLRRAPPSGPRGGTPARELARLGAHGGLGALLFAAIAWLALTPGRETSPEARFTWNQANAQAVAARTPDEFAAAAEAYRELIAEGVVNGPVCYNLGTAMLKAGRHEEAFQALLRAERCAGSGADIRRNLALVRRATGRAGASWLWLRRILFWHYEPSPGWRFRLAAGVFSLAWIMLAGSLLRPETLWRRAVRACAILLVLFGGSGAVSALSGHPFERAAGSHGGMSREQALCLRLSARLGQSE